MACATADLAPAPGLAPRYADLIGKPFEWKARGPDKFDCYGLVEELSRRIGQKVPDYLSPTVHEEIAGLIDHSVPFWIPCEAGPGAIATIRLKYVIDGRVVSMVSHVGMVLPHDRLIHAWQQSGGVCVERLDAWMHRIAGFYRFPQE